MYLWVKRSAAFVILCLVFNGTVPPAFTFTESEVIGVPVDKAGTRLDPDMAVMLFTKSIILRTLLKLLH